MGLFDQVFNALTGETPGEAASTHAALVETLAGSQGGLNGILDKLRGAGLDEVVGSWIGHGQNMPISAETIQQVLGSGFVQQLAQRTGLPLDQIAPLIAQHLPGVVDGLTPDGEVRANSGSELLVLGASLLKNRFGIG
ncbi:YidB family protein [Rhodopila sp.]|uniref:YidB family protein n=1 Tax=Rhodopila sp. TaxID=2480087 RepID=UPI002CC78F69|nr:YidB family protein [Rhodopila sp.]HVZ09168.1 YidB family protein [Rhodopila sp.]